MAADGPSLIERAERVGAIGAVLVPFGLLLYSVLYLPVETFYLTFGLTPQQAGVDQVVLISRVLVALVLLLAALVPLAALIASVLWLANRLSDGRLATASHRFWGRPWQPAIVLGVLTAALTAVNPWFDIVEAPWWVQFLVVPLVAVPVFAVPIALLRASRSARGAVSLVLVLLTGLAGSTALTHLSAASGVEVANTGEVGIGLSLLGIQPQYATLRWTGDSPPLVPEHKVVFLLGMNDGAYSLYDCVTATTFRVPVEGVELTRLAQSHGNGPACHSSEPLDPGPSPYGDLSKPGDG